MNARLAAWSLLALALAGAPAGAQGNKEDAPDAPERIKAGDRLYVHVLRAFVTAPIQGVYRVERGGTVQLGPAYGRVMVRGLTFEGAEAAIRQHLSALLKDPEVAVTGYDPESGHGGTSLDARLRRLEEELHEIREAVNRLRR